MPRSALAAAVPASSSWQQRQQGLNPTPGTCHPGPNPASFHQWRPILHTTTEPAAGHPWRRTARDRPGASTTIYLDIEILYI